MRRIQLWWGSGEGGRASRNGHFYRSMQCEWVWVCWCMCIGKQLHIHLGLETIKDFERIKLRKARKKYSKNVYVFHFPWFYYLYTRACAHTAEQNSRMKCGRTELREDQFYITFDFIAAWLAVVQFAIHLRSAHI